MKGKVKLDFPLQINISSFTITKCPYISINDSLNVLSPGNVGTVHWTAPEVLSSQRYQFPADIYGLGMILYEMISGKIPFHNLIPVAVMMAVAINKQQPEMPKDCNSHLVAIVKRYGGQRSNALFIIMYRATSHANCPCKTNDKIEGITMNYVNYVTHNVIM